MTEPFYLFLAFAFGFLGGYIIGLTVPKKIEKIDKGGKTDGHTS
jgi:hypothetical protein